jgi:hypothetical protein
VIRWHHRKVKQNTENEHLNGCSFFFRSQPERKE